MHNIELALDASWQILLWSLLLGAGLPAVFAMGVRSLSWGGDTSVQPEDRPSPLLAQAVTTVCFMVVLVTVALALTFIVASGFGKTLDLDHGVPTLSDKA
jgi:hypothetical protein